MIAIDTNVLLRRVLDDEPHQSKKARELFDSTDRILVTDIVLVETLWTLKGKRYNASAQDIAAVVTSLIEEPSIEFENVRVVWAALNDFMGAVSTKPRTRKQVFELPDALIVRKAQALIEQWGERYEGTYTFDQAASLIAGTKAL